MEENKEKTCKTCAFGDLDGDDMIWCDEDETLKDPDDHCCHYINK